MRTDGAERGDAESPDHLDDGCADHSPDVGALDIAEHLAHPVDGGTDDCGSDDPGAVGAAHRGEAHAARAADRPAPG